MADIPIPPQHSTQIGIDTLVAFRTALGEESQVESPHTIAILTALDQIILKFATDLVPHKGN